MEPDKTSFAFGNSVYPPIFANEPPPWDNDDNSNLQKSLEMSWPGNTTPALKELPTWPDNTNADDAAVISNNFSVENEESDTFADWSSFTQFQGEGVEGTKRAENESDNEISNSKLCTEISKNEYSKQLQESSHISRHFETVLVDGESGIGLFFNENQYVTRLSMNNDVGFESLPENNSETSFQTSPEQAQQTFFPGDLNSNNNLIESEDNVEKYCSFQGNKIDGNTTSNAVEIDKDKYSDFDKEITSSDKNNSNRSYEKIVTISNCENEIHEKNVNKSLSSDDNFYGKKEEFDSINCSEDINTSIKFSNYKKVIKSEVSGLNSNIYDNLYSDLDIADKNLKFSDYEGFQNFESFDVQKMSNHASSKPYKLCNDPKFHNFNSEDIADMSGKQEFNSEDIVEISGEQVFDSEDIVEMSGTHELNSEDIIDMSSKQEFNSEDITDMSGKQEFNSEDIVEISSKQELNSEDIIDMFSKQEFDSEDIVDMSGKKEFSNIDDYSNYQKNSVKYQSHDVDAVDKKDRSLRENLKYEVEHVNSDSGLFKKFDNENNFDVTDECVYFGNVDMKLSMNLENEENENSEFGPFKNISESNISLQTDQNEHLNTSVSIKTENNDFKNFNEVLSTNSKDVNIDSSEFGAFGNVAEIKEEISQTKNFLNLSSVSIDTEFGDFGKLNKELSFNSEDYKIENSEFRDFRYISDKKISKEESGEKEHLNTSNVFGKRENNDFGQFNEELSSYSEVNKENLEFGNFRSNAESEEEISKTENLNPSSVSVNSDSVAFVNFIQGKIEEEGNSEFSHFRKFSSDNEISHKPGGHKIQFQTIEKTKDFQNFDCEINPKEVDSKEDCTNSEFNDFESSEISEKPSMDSNANFGRFETNLLESNTSKIDLPRKVVFKLDSLNEKVGVLSPKTALMVASWFPPSVSYPSLKRFYEVSCHVSSGDLSERELSLWAELEISLEDEDRWISQYYLSQYFENEISSFDLQIIPTISRHHHKHDKYSKKGSASISPAGSVESCDIDLAILIPEPATLPVAKNTLLAKSKEKQSKKMKDLTSSPTKDSGSESPSETASLDLDFFVSNGVSATTSEDIQATALSFDLLNLDFSSSSYDLKTALDDANKENGRNSDNFITIDGDKTLTESDFTICNPDTTVDHGFFSLNDKSSPSLRTFSPKSQRNLNYNSEIAQPDKLDVDFGNFNSPDVIQKSFSVSENHDENFGNFETGNKFYHSDYSEESSVKSRIFCKNVKNIDNADHNILPNPDVFSSVIHGENGDENIIAKGFQDCAVTKPKLTLEDGNNTLINCDIFPSVSIIPMSDNENEAFSGFGDFSSIVLDAETNLEVENKFTSDFKECHDTEPISEVIDNFAGKVDIGFTADFNSNPTGNTITAAKSHSFVNSNSDFDKAKELKFFSPANSNYLFQENETLQNSFCDFGSFPEVPIKHIPTKIMQTPVICQETNSNNDLPVNSIDSLAHPESKEYKANMLLSAANQNNEINLIASKAVSENFESSEIFNDTPPITAAGVDDFCDFSFNQVTKPQKGDSNFIKDDSKIQAKIVLSNRSPENSFSFESADEISQASIGRIFSDGSMEFADFKASAIPDVEGWSNFSNVDSFSPIPTVTSSENLANSTSNLTAQLDSNFTAQVNLNNEKSFLQPKLSQNSKSDDFGEFVNFSSQNKLSESSCLSMPNKVNLIQTDVPEIPHNISKSDNEANFIKTLSSNKKFSEFAPFDVLAKTNIDNIATISLSDTLSEGKISFPSDTFSENKNKLNVTENTSITKLDTEFADFASFSSAPESSWNTDNMLPSVASSVAMENTLQPLVPENVSENDRYSVFTSFDSHKDGFSDFSSLVEESKKIKHDNDISQGTASDYIPASMNIPNNSYLPQGSEFGQFSKFSPNNSFVNNPFSSNSGYIEQTKVKTEQSHDISNADQFNDFQNFSVQPPNQIPHSAQSLSTDPIQTSSVFSNNEFSSRKFTSNTSSLELDRVLNPRLDFTFDNFQSNQNLAAMVKNSPVHQQVPANKNITLGPPLTVNQQSTNNQNIGARSPLPVNNQFLAIQNYSNSQTFSTDKDLSTHLTNSSNLNFATNQKYSNSQNQLFSSNQNYSYNQELNSSLNHAFSNSQQFPTHSVPSAAQHQNNPYPNNGGFQGQYPFSQTQRFQNQQRFQQRQEFHNNMQKPQQRNQINDPFSSLSMEQTTKQFSLPMSNKNTSFFKTKTKLNDMKLQPRT